MIQTRISVTYAIWPWPWRHDLWSYSATWYLPLTNAKWHSDPWQVTVTSQPIRLFTNFMTLIPSLTFTVLRVVPWSICNGCGMPAGNTYPSGHLVPSLFWDFLMLALSRQVFPNLPCLFSTFQLEYSSVFSPLFFPLFQFPPEYVMFPDFEFRTPLGTSILHWRKMVFSWASSFVAITYSFITRTANRYITGTWVRGMKTAKMITHEN